jgi:hypothetical protein
MFRASILLVLLLLGCSSGPKLPPLAPVSGVVTINGAPVPRGTVQFVPEGGGPTATGEIGADGGYTLKTAGVDGAMVGTHLVKVDARDVPKGDWDTLPKYLTPKKYASEKASGLKFEVKAGQSNKIDLPLVGMPDS